MMNTAYSLKAELYDKYRWEYPKEAIDWISEMSGINRNSVIAEFGAGTGILTKQFSNKCLKIYAIEPDLHMSHILEMKKYPNVVVIKKKAHDVAVIADQSVDILMVAHALHWFKYDKTLKEFKRIAKPGHWLVNVKNRFSETDIINNAVTQVLERYRKPVYISQANFVTSDYFNKKDYEEKEFNFVLEEAFEAYLGSLSSVSFYPDASDGESYDSFAKDVATLFEKYSRKGKMRFDCVTTVSVGKVRD